MLAVGEVGRQVVRVAGVVGRLVGEEEEVEAKLEEEEQGGEEWG